MNLFGALDISASALQAERVRAEVIAANMANSETTRTADGGVYQREHVVFEAQDGSSFQESLLAQGLAQAGLGANGQPSLQNAFGPGGKIRTASFLGAMPGSAAANGLTPGGVAVTGIVRDESDPLKRYEPGNPDADEEGFVAYPDINPLTEMVDLMGATRSYGMNATAVQAEKGMIAASFDLLK
jgi:flagellar basal-body rod protein FlgC